MKRILPLLIFFTPLVSFSQFTAIPDTNFEQALIDLGHDTGTPDGQVLTANISGVTLLDVWGSSINDLIGIEDFAALEELYCEENQLTSLDVTQNTALTYIWCESNQLSCLNLANGYNINLYIDASDNPSLTCVEVDDPAWSAANWTVAGGFIDPGVTFSTNCNNACSTVGIEEYSNQPKKLIRIIDLLGRETPFKPNTPLIYQYDDGSVEKVIREY